MSAFGPKRTLRPRLCPLVQLPLSPGPVSKSHASTSGAVQIAKKIGKDIQMVSISKTWLGLLGACTVSIVVAIPSAHAQQTTGTPGSPSATTTIPGNQLPAPDPKFGGVIEETAKDSKPYWPPRVVPPKGAPNVLLIMTDDQGYGVTSTFGGVIPTPAMDRIAKA